MGPCGPCLCHGHTPCVRGRGTGFYIVFVPLCRGRVSMGVGVSLQPRTGMHHGSPCPSIVVLRTTVVDTRPIATLYKLVTCELVKEQSWKGCFGYFRPLSLSMFEPPPRITLGLKWAPDHSLRWFKCAHHRLWCCVCVEWVAQSCQSI